MNINLTLFGQLIAFAIFVWFCMKFVWPPLIAAMRDRQAQIAEGLDAANRAAHDLEVAQQKATDQLAQSKQKAAEIVEQANKRALVIIDDAKEAAKLEGERIIHSAQAEVQQEVSKAKEELRKQVADLAVQGASKILNKSVDANAHNELLQKLAEEL